MRIICFSFNRVDVPHEKVELYSRFDKQEEIYPSQRFMMVVDMAQALIFSQSGASEGLYTNNSLIVKITAEHIHNDIYLTEFEKSSDLEPIHIRTIHEQTNEMVQDDLKTRKN